MSLFDVEEWVELRKKMFIVQDVKIVGGPLMLLRKKSHHSFPGIT